EKLGSRILDAGPVHRLQPRQRAEDGARRLLAITRDDAFEAFGHAVDLAIELRARWLDPAFPDFEEPTVVAEAPVRRDVEGRAAPAATDEDRATRRHAMPHTQLIEHVGIEDGHVYEHYVGRHELEEHVRTDVASALLFVSAKRLAAGLLDGRLQEER